jgi:hypothetical protein
MKTRAAFQEANVCSGSVLPEQAGALKITLSKKILLSAPLAGKTI